eukprot:s225_g38.t1
MFSDISFAPAGERSLQGILGFYGGGLVQWEASCQAFVVLNAAEGELMSYLESMVMGDSLASLIEVVEGQKGHAEDHLRGQHRRNSQFGKPGWAKAYAPFASSGQCTSGKTEGWKLDHPTSPGSEIGGRFPDQDHHGQNQLGTVLEVRAEMKNSERKLGTSPASVSPSNKEEEYRAAQEHPRWLMIQLSSVTLPWFNQQVYENAELIVKLALKGPMRLGEEQQASTAMKSAGEDEPMGSAGEKMNIQDKMNIRKGIEGEEQKAETSEEKRGLDQTPKGQKRRLQEKEKKKAAQALRQGHQRGRQGCHQLASGVAVRPKAPNYYEVDGGEWLRWDENGWGEKWEPGKKKKKKKKKKRKYTQEEWGEWYREHPEEAEETESSTPRTTTASASAPPEPKVAPVQQVIVDLAERPRIRPGNDLIRRPEDKNEWMRHLTEVDLRMVAFAITGAQLDWLTSPPNPGPWGDAESVADLWKVPEGDEYSRIIVRIHYRWRENAFHPEHPTLPKNIDQLLKFRVSCMWNSTDQETEGGPRLRLAQDLG